MKKILIVVLLVGFLAAAGFAQDFNNPQIMEKLGLTPQQIEQLNQIYVDARKTIREAQLDIDIWKAQLKKELAQNNVDLRQVERLLKSVLDLEYDVRLAGITREVNIRRVIGDEAWTLLLRTRLRSGEETGAGAGETTRERKESSESEPSHTQDSKNR